MIKGLVVIGNKLTSDLRLNKAKTYIQCRVGRVVGLGWGLRG